MQNQGSVLLKTSAASDIQHSGGKVYIADLPGSITKSRIVSANQIKYRAEVSQVITVGGTSYTPTGSTKYTILIGGNKSVDGQPSKLKAYTYETPATITEIGGSEAVQREAIHDALVALINADASQPVTAASSGSGNGLTITDDAGYYPAFSHTGTGRIGKSTVVTAKDPSGGGFNANYATTTAAVYASGVGATLAAGVPVIDPATGGLISGYLSTSNAGWGFKTTGGESAVTGQKYDIFVITALNDVAAYGGDGTARAFTAAQYAIAVDNGTGSSVTNLAGFKAFERVMHKLMVSVYANDPSTTQEWFDAPIVFQDPLGAAPSGTADTLGWQLSPYSSLNRTNIGTQTIVAPVLDATGLLLDQDDTATEGSHTSAYQGALGDQSFIVGETAFSVTARVVAGDWTDTQFLVGFRKKAVYNADYNAYTDLAAIGGGAADGDSVTTQGILNNASTVATDSTVNFTDAVSVLLQVRVAIDGTVSAYVDGVSCPIYSAGTTTLILDAGDEMIPFYQHVNIGSGNPAVSIGEFFAVASDSLVA